MTDYSWGLTGWPLGAPTRWQVIVHGSVSTLRVDMPRIPAGTVRIGVNENAVVAYGPGGAELLRVPAPGLAAIGTVRSVETWTGMQKYPVDEDSFRREREGRWADPERPVDGKLVPYEQVGLTSDRDIRQAAAVEAVQRAFTGPVGVRVHEDDETPGALLDSIAFNARYAADRARPYPGGAPPRRRDLAAIAAMSAVMLARGWDRIEPEHLAELAAIAVGSGDRIRG